MSSFIGATCDDCGKEIGMLDASYYKQVPGSDIGKQFHSHCGDPFGIRVLKAENERLRKGIQDYLDGKYGHDYNGSKIVKCPHGMYRHEPCEACIDEHFAKVLNRDGETK